MYPVLRPAERLIYRLCGVAEDHEMGLSLLRLLPRLQLRGAALLVRDPAAAGASAMEPRPRTQHEAVGGFQHRGELRHQHQLAGLRPRNPGQLPHPDARPGPRELRLGGRRASRWGSPSFAASRATPCASSVTSGSTSRAASSTSSCPSASSAPSVLVSQGVVQNLNGPTHAVTVQGVTQTIAQGPFASQEIDQGAGQQRRRLLQRQLRPPVREPHAGSQTSSRCWPCSPSPSSFTYMFGRYAGNQRQGWALFAAAMVLVILSVSVMLLERAEGQPQLHQGRCYTGRHGHAVGRQPGGQRSSQRHRRIRAVLDGHHRHVDRRRRTTPTTASRPGWRHGDARYRPR